MDHSFEVTRSSTYVDPSTPDSEVALLNVSMSPETGWTRAGTFRVEATVDGRAVMLRGVSDVNSIEPPRRTWVTPPPRDRYASPLPVLLDPDDPDVAMAAADAQELADPELLPGDLVALAAAAAVTAAATAIVWAFERRRTAPRAPRHSSTG